MSIVVSLRDVVDAMDVLNDDIHAYLKKLTGELLTATTEELSAIEEGDDWSNYPDWQHAALEDARRIIESDDFLELPDKFEIHEYAIMQDFCYALENPRLRDDMASRIRGSGAFRHFKDGIHYHGIQEDWYRFRQQALEAIAIEWLESHAIAFTKTNRTE